MFLRKPVKLISMALLFFLLAWYSRLFLMETGEDLLVCTWNRTFHRFEADCIYWITMRLAAWILIYLHLLRLESGFSIYLFLTEELWESISVHLCRVCWESCVLLWCRDIGNGNFPQPGITRYEYGESAVPERSVAGISRRSVRSLKLLSCRVCGSLYCQACGGGFFGGSCREAAVKFCNEWEPSDIAGSVSSQFAYAMRGVFSYLS